MHNCDDLEQGVGQWAGRLVYHGTGTASAADIVSNGISMKKSMLGYFGRGFYTADHEALAKSNYADMAANDGDEDGDGGPGVVLCFRIANTARILDMRIPEDWETYNRLSNNGRLISNPSFDAIMRKSGVDGLFDRSFGGVVFYNPRALTLVQPQSDRDGLDAPEASSPQCLSRHKP